MSEPNITQLQGEWNRLRLLYGIVESPPELDRLMLKWRRKEAQRRFLRDRIAELTAERSTLRTETDGIELTLRAYLNDVILTLKEEQGYGWSPTPVLGFRVWKLSPVGFHGYREHWKSPELLAECPTTGSSEDIPHTNGICGSPPCGIYAAKAIEDLLLEHRDWDLAETAIGLVAMTGKVVEHERGYRAEHVAVLAVTLPQGGALHTTGDIQEIEFLFQGVGLSTIWSASTNGGIRQYEPKSELEKRITEDMNEQKRRKSEWILETPNEL